MPKRPKKSKAELATEALFTAKARKAPPFAFVIDALGTLPYRTRPMFGCIAVHVGEKIVLFLRNKQSHAEDNGVWIATTAEHHPSLRREFPNMGSIALLGKDVRAWQVLPAECDDFEEAVMRLCDLVLARDPRIGTVPTAKTKTKVVRKRAVLRER